MKSSEMPLKVLAPSGFTLIELLVVLTLLSILGTFVGPNLWKQFNKVSERSQIQDVNQKLLDERKRAYREGRSLQLNREFLLSNNRFPDDWELLSVDAIYFLPSGVTNGGRLMLRASSGNQWQLSLSPLDGHADIQRL